MNKDKSIIYYVILGIFCSYFILGNNFFSFTNTSWLNSIDMAQDIVSWKYFKNDIWRFPIGMNPNYGIDIGNSIVFTGAVPILAIFFKIFKFILPENFHFFNLWYFVCFFLQSYIAYKIIYALTKNSLYSFLGSLFFLISPILIGRLVMHMSLAAHWVILFAFYIELIVAKKKKLKYWIFIISFSALIHFYLTLMLLGLFFIFTASRLLDDKNFKLFFIENFLNLIILIFIMFVFGYFEVPITDSVGVGYGNYKLNLASIFNPLELINNGQILWSNILPSIKMSSGEQSEGFNYLGLGGILLLLILIITSIFRFKDLNFYKLKPFILIVILFTLVALTNKIYFSNVEILSFNINKYLYGVLGIIRASGRFFWPVYYLIFIGSIIIIYKNFSTKKSIGIISIILLFQIIDLSNGFFELKNNKIFAIKDNKKNIFWKNLDNQFDTIRTVYINNNSPLIYSLKNVLLDKRFNKTDIFRMGRYNRAIASRTRAELNLKFNNKLLDEKTIFIIENNNYLRNLKYLFKNQNAGFFFIDGVWVLAHNQKSKMNEQDINKFNNIDFIYLNLNKKVDFNFYNKENINGLGWTHNQNLKGIWSEGKIATILFSSNLNYEGRYIIKIKVKSLSIKNKENLKFKVLLNKKIKKEFSVNDVKKIINQTIFLKIDQNEIQDNNYVIDFLIENPVSPLEQFKSPDGRKLGILIESLELSKLE
ncbi:MAG: hypothetical protein H8E55_09370 [Pelagibacterales bacterium]|nr:hypothetical protein [Pelagibacterales bacterium]